MTDNSVWDRVAALVTGRRSWIVAVLVLLVSGALIGAVGSNSAAESAPTSLPADADSARVGQLLEQFPDADISSVILVVTRADGGQLTGTDLASIADAQARMN
ncbi:MAG: MMPL family transporter, partial [Rhodococcus sp. (in: high G+C Gram-positive bacteria)]